MSARESKALRVRADLAEIERVRAFLRENLLGLKVGEEVAMMLELALQEIMANIAMYAYPEAGGDVAVRIWNSGSDLYLELRDQGIPFNPSERPPLDLMEKIRQGTSGGLGIFLFTSLMDGCAYKRDGEENVLTIFKKI